jgi:thiol-disulfide isomerase/thioredoxin
MKRSFVPFGLLLSSLFALLLSTCTAGKAGQGQREQAVPDRLARLELLDLNGAKVPWEKFAGRPLFLNFWATWCAPCVAEMGTIEQLHREYGDAVTFVALSNEAPEKIRAFQEGRSLSFSFLQLQGEYIDAFVVKLPTTLLIGSDGHIVAEEEGSRNWSSPEMRQLMEQLQP